LDPAQRFAERRGRAGVGDHFECRAGVARELFIAQQGGQRRHRFLVAQGGQLLTRPGLVEGRRVGLQYGDERLGRRGLRLLLSRQEG
jgi:hypothetical protein